MQSSTLHIADVRVDGTGLKGVARGGVLISGSRDLWQVHVATTRNASWEVGADHDLEIVTREGETVRGRAVLRQSDGWAHLFQGAGDILRRADGVSSTS
jgi:hypothetical protein